MPTTLTKPHTTAQFHETKLLHILDTAGVPHGLYKQILDWAKAAKQDNYNFLPERTSRNSQLQFLKKWLNFGPECEPYVLKTRLPGEPIDGVNVTVFNCTSQLFSLLNDQSLFGDLNNLDINPSNVFGKYKSTSNLLSTVNSGNLYEQAYNKMILDKDKDFLMPIIFSCDETHLSAIGKTGCWPLMFTTSILNQSMRNQPRAWKPLGYVYDLSLLHSSNEEKQFSSDLKYSRLHAVFDSIL